MILVSSCLAGQPVRYNGTDCFDDKIGQLIREGKAMTVCPELLGGFLVPRQPAEIIGGNGYDVLDGKANVMDITGEDVTDLYVKGAYETLRAVHDLHASHIILKETSPSCGSTTIYNGEFKGQKIQGVGVTTALLRRNGFQVISEENIDEFLHDFS